jgi:quinol monooxygenase YgiN
MELLVATLARTLPDKEEDGLARVHLIADTVRNAPGLINAGFYRSLGRDSYYFMLTTWEDEDFWQKAQERYNPGHLLLGSATELLMAPPEQWLMSYLWGYSRPTTSAAPIVAAAHLVTLRPDQVEPIQRGWIEGLRRQAVEPILAFAFLARGMNEEAALSTMPSTGGNKANGEVPIYQQGSIFLNLLSWPGEAEREEFYSDPTYQAISRLLKSRGVVQILPLEPF